MVVAEEGPFQTPGRGEFDAAAIKEIAKLMAAKPVGLKSRFAHPGLSSDGIGRYLGRAKDARVVRETRERADGSTAPVWLVRADLHLSPVSFDAPEGNLGKYVLDLAEEDPGAFASSLVLEADEQFRTDTKGKPLSGPDGEPLPPLWRPTRLHATDVVDEGDAVHGGFLSAGGASLDIERLPDAVVRQAWKLLDRQFGKKLSRERVEGACLKALGRYLDARFGKAGPPPPTPRLDGLAPRLEEMALTARRLRGA